jgi:glycosyltransferase involved in cell wall biosynthesis
VADIGFVIGNLNKGHGGAQQLLFDICRHLPESEFDTTVYYMFGEGTYAPQFETRGTTVIDLEASSNYDTLSFKNLVSYLKNSEHDILQTNSPISGVWGRVAGALGNIPHIVSVEHSVHTGYPLLNRVANGITLPLSDTIVGVSNAVTNSLLPWEQFLLQEGTRIRVIRNGVDMSDSEDKSVKNGDIFSETPISAKKPIIGSVGRFTEAKGYKYLLRSFPEIKQNCADAQLLLIGDGELMPDLKRKARATGYSEDVFFTGFISNVFPYLSSFDIAVFPSLWEGFGLTPVEAMATKCPVVASDIPAFREVINDAGLLVESKDELGLAEAVISLIEDPTRREKLGEKGYERAVEHFSIERTVEEYADLYRDLACE